MTDVAVGGETFHLTHPESAEALFDEREFARDERIPYWADLWPSARGLAAHLLKLDLAGRRAIELGCGIGLPGIVAASRGAHVTATDHYAPALDFAAYNARTNTGRLIDTRLLDWHRPETAGLGAFDLILAADVLYERRNVAPLAALTTELLSEKGEIILADPRRAGGGLFVREMGSRGFSAASEETTVVQDGRNVTVAVHHLSR